MCNKIWINKRRLDKKKQSIEKVKTSVADQTRGSTKRTETFRRLMVSHTISLLILIFSWQKPVPYRNDMIGDRCLSYERVKVSFSEPYNRTATCWCSKDI